MIVYNKHHKISTPPNEMIVFYYMVSFFAIEIDRLR